MARFLSALLCAIALLAPCTRASADDATDCRRPGPFDQRVASCTRLIAKGGPPDGLALIHAIRGGVHLDRGNRDAAIADLEHAMTLDASSPESHRYRGVLHSARRQHDQAVAAHSEAIRRDPKLARAWRSRGGAYLALGDHDRAVADLTQAIRLDGGDAVAHNVRGRAYEARGDLELALADFAMALRLVPEYANALNNRGIYWRNRGDFERAVVEHSEAIRLDPTFAAAYSQRAYAIAEMGDHARAITDYDAAIRLDRNYAGAYNGRGNARRKTNDFTGALADYDKAVSIEPTSPVFYSNRGHLLVSQGQRERAKADFETVVQLPAPRAADKQRLEVARARLERLAATPASSPAKGKASPAFRHKRVALIIGNSRYVHASPLANTIADARALSAALRRLSFTSVVELSDVGRDAMLQALKIFGDRVEGAEWALVFFAGHGIEVSGTTYIVPIDAALKRDKHVADEAISLDRVLAKVDGASKIGLVILDACRTNPFLSRMVRSGGTRAIGQGLAPIEPEGNVIVAYAARHGTVAEDGTGSNSPFTTALLAHIEQRGVEIDLLFRKVRDDVRTATAKRQEPFTYSSLGSEPLFFAP